MQTRISQEKQMHSQIIKKSKSKENSVNWNPTPKKNREDKDIEGEEGEERGERGRLLTVKRVEQVIEEIKSMVFRFYPNYDFYLMHLDKKLIM